MKISFAVLWEVKVDDHVYGLYIDSTGKKIRADEVAAYPIAEIMENTITMGLQHLCVRVEARISELCHLFGQELDTLSRITKDDRLVYLQLETNMNESGGSLVDATHFGEEGVQAMYFLPLFHISIKLRNPKQSKFFHEVNFIRRLHVLFLWS
jgi:hypothetical protein